MFKKKSKATFVSFVDQRIGADKHISTPAAATSPSKSVNQTGSTAMNKSSLNITEQEDACSKQFLPGEIVVLEVRNVARYLPFSDGGSGVFGSLYITTYRLSFVPIVSLYHHNISNNNSNNNIDDDKSLYRAHKFLTSDDIPLTNINEVYQVGKNKRKKLHRGGSLPRGGCKKLEVYCKDFSLHLFSFNNVEDSDDVKKLLYSIIQFTNPTRHELLFANVFKGTCSSGFQSLSSVYNEVSYWLTELSNCNAIGYRVTNCNSGFKLAENLPECFVVPESLTDELIHKYNLNSSNPCFPIWSYTHTNGVSLLRMSYESNPGSENIVLQHIVKQISSSTTSCDAVKMKIVDLGSPMLGLPTTTKDLWRGDGSWCASVESSRWMACVSAFLYVAQEVVHLMTVDNRIVILKDHTVAHAHILTHPHPHTSTCSHFHIFTYSHTSTSSHIHIFIHPSTEAVATDYSLLISCLCQLMMNERVRKLDGFERMIEREWMSMGHPFCYRLGFLSDANNSSNVGSSGINLAGGSFGLGGGSGGGGGSSSSGSSNHNTKSPVFQAFLDCVWQITQQHRDQFEFSTIYLTTLHDSLFVGLFDAFVCNSPKQRRNYSSSCPRHQLFDVFDWQVQYNEYDISYFRNPLYYKQFIRSIKSCNLLLDDDADADLDNLIAGYPISNPLTRSEINRSHGRLDDNKSVNSCNGPNVNSHIVSNINNDNNNDNNKIGLLQMIAYNTDSINKKILLGHNFGKKDIFGFFKQHLPTGINNATAAATPKSKAKFFIDFNGDIPNSDKPTTSSSLMSSSLYENKSETTNGDKMSDLLRDKTAKRSINASCYPGSPDVKNNKFISYFDMDSNDSNLASSLTSSSSSPLLSANKQTDPDTLYIKPYISCLHFWDHCYLRWLSPLELLGGGHLVEYFTQVQLILDITSLQYDITKLKNKINLLDGGSRDLQVREKKSTPFRVPSGTSINPNNHKIIYKTNDGGDEEDRVSEDGIYKNGLLTDSRHEVFDRNDGIDHEIPPNSIDDDDFLFHPNERLITSFRVPATCPPLTTTPVKLNLSHIPAPAKNETHRPRSASSSTNDNQIIGSPTISNAPPYFLPPPEYFTSSYPYPIKRHLLTSFATPIFFPTENQRSSYTDSDMASIDEMSSSLVSSC
ncbi:hypothetical protein HELRODRAFT_193550 [Helobdella robusta]|uniref:Myotubularin phosphatase domain-containing protein n=1 Tax=Helobdella robusta TaxID=6412 RepID=T1FV42_HELRO|nr:hypothetical protein HELRODRAFT_193550 [Helobdella robusta]ESN95316.1 hypothetical protein HELRODRAFT_193550 [Helobdella robusta]